MKSFKRGRAPSMVDGTVSVMMAVFGVIWMIFAVSIGAGAFALFGLVFIAIAIVQAVYHFKNATSDNRFSEFDITENEEEPDPLNRRDGTAKETHEGGYCPYCGAKTEADYEFCRSCGRRLGG